MEPHTNPLQKMILVGISILILTAVLIFLYWNNLSSENSMSRFKKEYRNATNLSSSGDTGGAIEEFRRLLSETTDKTEQGKLKILLAGNLFSRNEGGDRNESIKLYKEVVNDYSYPPFVRALALNNIANIVNGQDESFYKLYFSDPPFDKFLPETGSSSYKKSQAYLGILELSIQTYPTSYAEYSIAGNYYVSALLSISNNTRADRLNGATQEDTAKLMQKYVRDGDSRNDDSLHVRHINLQKYLYRAFAINNAGRVLNNVDLKEREAAYKLILDKSASIEGTDDEKSKYILLQARFYYANFLSQNFGVERNAEIVDILRPFAEAKSASDYSSVEIRELFKNRSSSEVNNVIKEKSPLLAEISSDFKSFTESLSL